MEYGCPEEIRKKVGFGVKEDENGNQSVFVPHWLRMAAAVHGFDLKSEFCGVVAGPDGNEQQFFRTSVYDEKKPKKRFDFEHGNFDFAHCLSDVCHKLPYHFKYSESFDSFVADCGVKETIINTIKDYDKNNFLSDTGNAAAFLDDIYFGRRDDYVDYLKEEWDKHAPFFVDGWDNVVEGYDLNNQESLKSYQFLFDYGFNTDDSYVDSLADDFSMGSARRWAVDTLSAVYYEFEVPGMKDCLYRLGSKRRDETITVSLELHNPADVLEPERAVPAFVSALKEQGLSECVCGSFQRFDNSYCYDDFEEAIDEIAMTSGSVPAIKSVSSQGLIVPASAGHGLENDVFVLVSSLNVHDKFDDVGMDDVYLDSGFAVLVCGSKDDVNKVVSYCMKAKENVSDVVKGMDSDFGLFADSSKLDFFCSVSDPNSNRCPLGIVKNGADAVKLVDDCYKAKEDLKPELDLSDVDKKFRDREANLGQKHGNDSR